MWVVVLFAVAACGRIGFDPPAGNDGGGDGGKDGGGDAEGIEPDAARTACMDAIDVPVGVRVLTSTCKQNLLDGCGPPNTEEVVFKFEAPDANGYTFAAYDPGTNNVSNTVGRVNATCTGMTTACAGLLGTSFTPGEVVYFTVEASAGGCASIEFSAQ